MSDDNERILMQRRGVPAKAMTKLEAMMDPTNPNVFEANDNGKRIAELEAENRRLREALEQIAIYGCGMLSQPATLNEPVERWLRRRIREYERRARAALSQEEKT